MTKFTRKQYRGMPFAMRQHWGGLRPIKKRGDAKKKGK